MQQFSNFVLVTASLEEAESYYVRSRADSELMLYEEIEEWIQNFDDDDVQLLFRKDSYPELRDAFWDFLTRDIERFATLLIHRGGSLIDAIASFRTHAEGLLQITARRWNDQLARIGASKTTMTNPFAADRLEWFIRPLNRSLWSLGSNIGVADWCDIRKIIDERTRNPQPPWGTAAPLHVLKISDSESNLRSSGFQGDVYMSPSARPYSESESNAHNGESGHTPAGTLSACPSGTMEIDRGAPFEVNNPDQLTCRSEHLPVAHPGDRGRTRHTFADPILRSKGLSVYGWERKAGVAKNVARRWMRGTTRTLRNGVRNQLASALEIDPSLLA